jgi:hypothetical protein
LADIVQGARPDNGGRNCALVLPIGGDEPGGIVHYRHDLSAVGGREPARAFKVAQGAVENHMDQIADAERVEHQGFRAAFGHAPAERIDPDKAQRIAQQTSERAGRLRAGSRS